MPCTNSRKPLNVQRLIQGLRGSGCSDVYSADGWYSGDYEIRGTPEFFRFIFDCKKELAGARKAQKQKKRPIYR